MKTAIIFIFYIIAGLSTTVYLKRKNMKVAYNAYRIFFWIFFLYIPYLTSWTVMTNLYSSIWSEELRPVFNQFMTTPLIAGAEYFNFLFVISAILSLVLIITLAIFAIEFVSKLLTGAGEKGQKTNNSQFFSYTSVAWDSDSCPLWLRYCRITR